MDQLDHKRNQANPLRHLYTLTHSAAVLGLAMESTQRQIRGLPLEKVRELEEDVADSIEILQELLDEIRTGNTPN